MFDSETLDAPRAGTTARRPRPLRAVAAAQTERGLGLRANVSSERRAGYVALTVTLVASFGLSWHLLSIAGLGLEDGRAAQVVAAIALSITIAVLISGSLVYQACRFGHLSRQPGPDVHRFRGAREIFSRTAAPRVVVLVPSYKEEPRVVRQTLLSVLLQDHPNRSVVLLIDDPPVPGDQGDLELLQQTRTLVDELSADFRRFRRQAQSLQRRLRDGAATAQPSQDAKVTLVAALVEASRWVDGLRRREPLETHADELLHDRVLDYWIGELSGWASWIAGHDLTATELDAHSRRYAALFDVELSRFERKQYANLSHEPNKAMNINSYLTLLGTRSRAVRHPEGQVLVPVPGTSDATLEVPDAPYVVTVDADSVLHPHYISRLVGELELPEHARTAVIQTPYSAIRGAPTCLERIAGATTDLQFNIHQGFTQWDATFWVGANAVLRMSSIREIATVHVERGWLVTRFIQDRTVIEDTESSIDLVTAGWSLYNYPERLSWSATPPDFGALVVQRRRWANGGLIIAPKLIRLVRRRQPQEIAVRAHYLLSPAASNVAVALLLLAPFGAAFNTYWLPLAALPYFWLQHRDLRALHYPRGDIARVWALNLLLVPVNLAGVLKSIQQGLTGRKIPFARTPKTSSRTPVAPVYIAAPILAMLCSATAAGTQLLAGNAVQASFAALTAGLLAYALVTFIGPRQILLDFRSRTDP